EPAFPRRRDPRLPRFAVCRRWLAHGCDRRWRYRDERAALTATPSRLLSRPRLAKVGPHSQRKPVAMSIQAVLLPLFVQVALTFVLLFWTGYLRSNLLKTGAVKPQDIALREPNWPVRVAQIGNAYDNQLELPVLFCVLTILAWVTRHAD